MNMISHSPAVRGARSGDKSGGTSLDLAGSAVTAAAPGSFSDPYREYFERGGKITVLPPVYRGEAAAPKVTSHLSIEERIVIIHDRADPGTLHQIKSLLGIAPRIAEEVLRKAGREPRKPVPGSAYRTKHNSVMTAAKKSAIRRIEEKHRRMEPLMRLLAEHPDMTVKAAANQLGITYSVAKEYVRKQGRP